jgi:hypothetical protein
LGLRKQSFPFDWLWNQDLGLSAINEIIKNDYKPILGLKSYVLAKHYKMENSVIVYRNYPSIMHLHSNPLEKKDDHETLLRRIERFKNILNSKRKACFIYYKSHNEEYLKDKLITIEDTVNKMILQGNEFISMIANKDAQLLLILQIDNKYEPQAKKLIRYLKFDKKQIKIRYTIANDNNNKKLTSKWRIQWYKNIILNTDMSFFLQIMIIIRVFTLLLSKSKSKILKCI